MRTCAVPAMPVMIALTVALLPGAAVAKTDYPNRPLRFVVPFPPGGSNDIFARVIGHRLSESLGQPVLVDNRPGAGGMLGAEIVARAPGDGYNLMIHSTSFTTGAALQPKLPFDPLKDFAPVTQLAAGALIMTVRADSPARTMPELLALARAKPGALNFGSSGTGGINHLATELLNRTAKIDTVHVPYKGIGPAVTDLLGGQIQILLAGIPNVVGHIKAGKLRPLAVSTAKRSPFMPEVPTMAESGVTGYAVTLWWGLFVPGGTPRAIVARLNQEVVRVLQTDEMRERMAAEGAEPMPTTPEQFARFVREEIESWRRVVREAGIKPE
jgi:tripartite-type tricarboxylate transporter receptor subunit TctC